jgi:hypothetical protein
MMKEAVTFFILFAGAFCLGFMSAIVSINLALTALRDQK